MVEVVVVDRLARREHLNTCELPYPGMVVDVVVWCRNEISGQWGCVPTKLCPGAAYGDPSANAENVAKKIRRAAVSLAAFKGELTPRLA